MSWLRRKGLFEANILFYQTLGVLYSLKITINHSSPVTMICCSHAEFSPLRDPSKYTEGTVTLYFSKPQPIELEKHLETLREAPLSFPSLEYAKQHFHRDFIEFKVGQGDAAFKRTKVIMQAWSQFNSGTTFAVPQGRRLGVCINVMGMWVMAPHRMLDLRESPRYYRAVLGTLKGNPLSGIEVFEVSLSPFNEVMVRIESFAEPQGIYKIFGWWVRKFQLQVFQAFQGKMTR